MQQEVSTLQVQDLSVSYRSREAEVHALRQVSLTVQAGEVMGIVGESGSGKTTLVQAVMRYLPPGGTIRAGQIMFKGEDLAKKSRVEMRSLWGSQIALVPQDPGSSLNPSMRVGAQVSEVLEQHLQLGGGALRRRALELLEMVRITDPERIYESYPFELSGGMQQRALIAMALSTEPAMLVLDEPTTGLDATTQAVVLDLIRELMQERQTAALYVTHNLGVVAQLCDTVSVLYAGELLESGPTADLYHRPLHPYTRGLLDSVPRLGANKHEVRLRAIEGAIPALDELPRGCIFRTRCPLAIQICEEPPPLVHAAPARKVRCHRWEEIARSEVSARQPLPHSTSHRTKVLAGEPILELQELRVHFARSRTWLDLLTGRSPKTVHAVDGVDLQIQRPETLGLVGESGSGKTTLARAVMGLVPRTGGDISLEGQPLPARLKDRDRAQLRKMQIVIQNPAEALNPYLTVGESIRRPLQTLLGLARPQAHAQALDLLRAVKLNPEYANRFPTALSGGELQRVAIVRAFASSPQLLVADEAVSSLDVSVQASILNLMSELQQEHESAALFISHDLAVVGYLADKVAVIYAGQLMEVSPVEQVFEPPHHPYTEALLSAIPLIDPMASQERIRLEGEVPVAGELQGCPFHTRCPRFLGDICIEQRPAWQQASGGKSIYCHIPLEDLGQEQHRVFRFSQDVGEQP